MGRGGARAGAGRKLGGKNKYSLALAKKAKAAGMVEPVDLLLMISNDPENDVEVRARAAASAAPYIHKRKPQAHEITGRFEFLTPEELERRKAMVLNDLRAKWVAQQRPGSN